MEQKVNYLKLAPFINAKSFMEGKSYEWDTPSEEMINEFNDILTITGLKQHVISSTVETSGSLWKVLRDVYHVDEMYEDELFYNAKLGYRLAGVPSKLVYLISKTKTLYDTPNVGLSMLRQSLLSEFFHEGILHNSYTVADVVSNIYGITVKPLSPYRLRMQYPTFTEVFVANTSTGDLFNTVCVLPNDISNAIPDNKVSSIVYDPVLGLLLDGDPLRCYNGRKGVTLSDIDLRRGV